MDMLSDTKAKTKQKEFKRKEKKYSLVFHHISSAGKLLWSSTDDMHISRAQEMLNSKSGWHALAGTQGLWRNRRVK